MSDLNLRVLTLELDELDYDAIQTALARRQIFGRHLPGCTQGIMPDGNSNRAGALVAEICRGWMEMLDITMRKKP